MIQIEDMQAKSDQMNAVDLVKPIIFKIIRVDYNPRQPQPILIHLNGCEGRPYKPCKSMLRGLTRAWGMDEQLWTGRMIELYCEPTVKWAGQAIGGIRISGISGIDEPFEFTVQLNKSQREIQTMRPLPEATIEDQFILTHWEDKIKNSDTNKELDEIIKQVAWSYGKDKLADIKQAVISARKKIDESA